MRIRTPDDLRHKVEIGGLVHQLEPVVGGVGEQLLHSWPALADSVQDRLCACALGDVGCRQIDHHQAPVGVDRDGACVGRSSCVQRNPLFGLRCLH